MSNPYSPEGVYSPLGRVKAMKVVGLDPDATPNARGKWLPSPGYEKGIRIDDRTYWLVNWGGRWYFKHPDYEVKRTNSA